MRSRLSLFCSIKKKVSSFCGLWWCILMTSGKQPFCRQHSVGGTEALYKGMQLSCYTNTAAPGPLNLFAIIEKKKLSLELSLQLSIKFSFFHGVQTGRGMKEEESQISSKIKYVVINSVFFFPKVNLPGKENIQKVMLSSVIINYKNLHLLNRGGSGLSAWFLYLSVLVFWESLTNAVEQSVTSSSLPHLNRSRV